MEQYHVRYGEICVVAGSKHREHSTYSIISIEFGMFPIIVDQIKSNKDEKIQSIIFNFGLIR